jgi:Lon-like ATP-dependent protease
MKVRFFKLVDKLGRGHQGDPAAALLELLDPEQNSAFTDHYMDIPVDMSKVLFVCTGNTIDTIPSPLLDRMEVINLSGYVAEEKLAIAQKYLIPETVKNSGLSDYNVDLSENAVKKLITQYCRESGVRNLKKKIEQLYRKAAFKIVSDNMNEKALSIDENNLYDFVGLPIFPSDRLYHTVPAGVVMGLAWTQMGGSSLYIESVLDSSWKDDAKPHFHMTGQMGDVMKESTAIAYTFSKSFLSILDPPNSFFRHASIHMHVPEGATPKDGILV